MADKLLWHEVMGFRGQNYPLDVSIAWQFVYNSFKMTYYGFAWFLMVPLDDKSPVSKCP